MCSNYQPISILPIISNVFEKLMHIRLYDILKNKRLHENQFGFQEGKSTEHAVVDLYNNSVIQSTEKHNSVNRKTRKIQLHIFRFCNGF